ncbi:MAG TPA: hypothetical protein VGX25_14505 [Actinophytocola sp.]|uniref:hypothetical protein n=1 Tax=Actinophytocola sp. TaxID=1872138 RepID=UPI002DDD5BCB|nr:hypothetical protein [Actinophytocola sp.]HEV2780598.1 hypothetical protein [Actinophytocola sp.]
MTGQDLDALRRDRDQARAELDRVRAERDQLLADRTSVPGPDSDAHAELAVLRARVAELSVRAEHLRRELDAHRATISWRITAPLRAVRRLR